MDGDFVMERVCGAFVPLGDRKDDLGAGSGGVTGFLDISCTEEVSLLSVDEEVVVTDATLSFSKLLTILLLLASSGDMSCSGETRGACCCCCCTGGSFSLIEMTVVPLLFSLTSPTVTCRSTDRLSWVGSRPIVTWVRME